MAARLSALGAGRFLHPGRFLVLVSVRGWVDPRSIVRQKGLGKLKKKNPHHPEFEPATFQHAAQCLNQLRYRADTYLRQFNLHPILTAWHLSVILSKIPQHSACISSYHISTNMYISKYPQIHYPANPSSTSSYPKLGPSSSHIYPWMLCFKH
jgi:hypothetical protein